MSTLRRRSLVRDLNDDQSLNSHHNRLAVSLTHLGMSGGHLSPGLENCPANSPWSVHIKCADCENASKKQPREIIVRHLHTMQQVK